MATVRTPYQFTPPIANDPRINPYGPPRAYVIITVTDAWVFQQPTANSPRLTQILYGEACTVHHEQGEFYLIQSLTDYYCGWVHGSLLTQVTILPQHFTWRTRFIAPVTLEPNMKSPLLTHLAPDSRFAIEDKQGDYLKIANQGWLHHSHAVPIHEKFDIIETARLQIGRSYLWGGRSIAGIDCSSLAQLCYRLRGYEIPRDSDLQLAYLAKHHLTIHNAAELQAGDLIFTPGHVMIASDCDTVIHANAHHMRVVEEPLKDVITRMKTSIGKFGIRAHRWKARST